MDNNYNNSNNSNYNQIGGEPVNIIMEQNNVIGIDDSYKYEPPKKKSNIFYMVFGILAGVVLFGFIIYFNVILKDKPKSEETGTTTTVNVLKEEEKLNNNYEVIDTKLSDTDVLLEIKNNNDTVVKSTLRVELYNIAGEIVDKIEFEPLVISNKSSSYEIFSIDTSSAVSTYKAITKLHKFDYINNVTKDVSVINTSKIGNKVFFEYINNSREKINYISLGAFFYDPNKKIIGYERIVSNDELGVNASNEKEISIPYENPSNIRDSATVEVKVLTALQTKK